MSNPLENRVPPVPFGAASTSIEGKAKEPKTKARYGEIGGVTIHIRVLGKTDHEQRIPRGTKNQIIENTHEKVMRHVQGLDLRDVKELEVQLNSKGELKSFRFIPKGHQHHKNYTDYLDREKARHEHKLEKLSKKLNRAKEEKEKLEARKQQLEKKVAEFDSKGKEVRGTIHAKTLFTAKESLERVTNALEQTDAAFRKYDRRTKTEESLIKKFTRDKASLEELKKRFNAAGQMMAAAAQEKAKARELLTASGSGRSVSRSPGPSPMMSRRGVQPLKKEKERVEPMGPVILTHSLLSTPSSARKERPHPPSMAESQVGSATGAPTSSASSAIYEPKIPETDQKQILNILKEFADTEESYHTTIREATRRLRFMLSPQDPDHIPEEALNSELGRVLKDYEIMAQISQELESKIRIATMLGDNVNVKLRAINRIFESGFFTFYSKCMKDCVAHYNFLRKELDRLGRVPQWSKQIEKFRMLAPGQLARQDENSLFITSVQRMPRHVLMVEDIRKRVRTLPQEVRVERALTKAKQAAQSINRGQARQEGKQYISDLYGRLEGQETVSSKEYARELAVLAEIKDCIAIDYDTFFKLMSHKIPDVKDRIAALNAFFKGLDQLEAENQTAYQQLLQTIKESGLIRSLKAEIMAMHRGHRDLSKELHEVMQKTHRLTDKARKA